MLWESDIPIDLRLPRECVRVCPHDALPLMLFDDSSQAKHSGINFIEFCVTVPPPGNNLNYNTFTADKKSILNLSVGR